jgi:hypothetical protein
MHVLWALEESGLLYELKGGTSLSKGWGIIQRFSEDVDIKILPPTGMTVHTGKNHSKPKHRASRQQYFDWLQNSLKIPGSSYIRRDPDFDDQALRNVGYRIGYSSKYEPYSGLKADILLEVGFDNTTPNMKHDISSWLFDAALEAGLEVVDNRAKQVPCYLPEYTFVEKLSAISKRYRHEQEGRIVQNFTRHYYDVYQLLAEPRVLAFLGTPEYKKHKDARFGPSDNQDIFSNPAFTLSDLDTRNRYTERYSSSIGLYYRGQPSLDLIIQRIKDVIHLL